MPDGTEEEQEVLRRDVGGDLQKTFLAVGKGVSKDLFNLESLASSLDAASSKIWRDFWWLLFHMIISPSFLKCFHCLKILFK